MLTDSIDSHASNTALITTLVSLARCNVMTLTYVSVVAVAIPITVCAVGTISS